jgi:hypothetical protein
MNYIGIDPGKEGAIVVLGENGIAIHKETMVLLKDGTLDVKWLRGVLNTFCEGGHGHIIVEQVHAIFGSSAKSTFSFGYICGQIDTLVACSGLPYTKVQPKTWQKVAYMGVSEIRKAPIKITKGKFAGTTRPGPLDTKAMSLVAAQRLFPGADFRRNERCKVQHDGIVDAILIAEFGRRTVK